ncbi:MAG: hypothetical protein ACYC8T_14045 [Myxococcaceae bacterium]
MLRGKWILVGLVACLGTLAHAENPVSGLAAVSTGAVNPEGKPRLGEVTSVRRVSQHRFPSVVTRADGARVRSTVIFLDGLEFVVTLRPSSRETPPPEDDQAPRPPRDPDEALRLFLKLFADQHPVR